MNELNKPSSSIIIVINNNSYRLINEVPESIDNFIKTMKIISLQDKNIIINDMNTFQQYLYIKDFAVITYNNKTKRIYDIVFNERAAEILYIKNKLGKVEKVKDLISKMKIIGTDIINSNYFGNMYLKIGCTFNRTFENFDCSINFMNT